jgi:predicted ATP-dependent serine protease
MADLKECLRQFEEKGTVKPFALAKKDISNQFIIPQKLYGREKQIDSLMQTFEKVCEGTSRIMLVAGSPGIGKSALVKEIHKPIVAKRGYFISGKYDQFRKDRPYSSIIEAFQGQADPIGK